MIWVMAYFLKDNTSPYEITNLLDSAELLKWLFVGKKKKKKDSYQIKHFLVHY